MQTKELRKDAIVQQSLRIRAAKAWLLQRWPLCVAALLLLMLMAAAALQFRSNGTDGAAASGQQTILASMRCISISQLKSCLTHQGWDCKQAWSVFKNSHARQLSRWQCKLRT